MRANEPQSSCAQRLPFNVVDEAVYLLHSEAAPWSIRLEVRVSGSLDESRLGAAVAEALHRHPMARARKAISPLGGCRFGRLPG